MLCTKLEYLTYMTMSLEVKCIPLIIPMIKAINITIYTKRVVAIIVVRGGTVRNILLDFYSSNPGLSQYLTLILLKYFGM